MIGTDIIQSFSRELEKIALSDSQLRKLEQKAQPGDILMTSGIPVMEDRRLSAVDVPGAAVGRVIAKGFGGKYHHAGMYMGDGRWVDHNPISGVKERGIRSVGTGSVKLYRPKVSEGARAKAVANIKKQIGKPYSVSQVAKIWFAKKRGTVGDKKRAANSLICTNVVADAYRGELDFGREAELVGPWDIHSSKNVKKVTHLKGKQ
mgnify:CR=1 FL=1